MEKLIQRVYEKDGATTIYEAFKMLPEGFTLSPKLGKDRMGFEVRWKERESDYNSFFHMMEQIISSCYLDDETYAKKVLPRIYQIFQETEICKRLSNEVSPTQHQPVVKHIEAVPKFVNTKGCSSSERFVLRVAAIFHDLAKMFKIGRDPANLHALISSIIFAHFIEMYRADLSGLAESVNLTGFEDSIDEATQLIRLHHLLEQVDKGFLSEEYVTNILNEVGDNFSYLLGLFVIADGGSVTKAIYLKYLILNLNALVKLTNFNTEAINSFIEALKYIIALSSQDILNRMIEVVESIQLSLEPSLATALLSLTP